MAAFERLYIARYMAAHWPEGGYSLGYPLGPIPENIVNQLGYEAAAAQFRPWRSEIDAVKFFPNGLLLIEAKIMRPYDGVRGLIMYHGLIPHTPELKPWWGADNRMRLIAPVINDVARLAAERLGIQVDTWSDPETEEHAARYQRYWSREATLERNLRKQKLAELGLAPKSVLTGEGPFTR